MRASACYSEDARIIPALVSKQTASQQMLTRSSKQKRGKISLFSFSEEHYFSMDTGRFEVRESPVHISASQMTYLGHVRMGGCSGANEQSME